MATQRVFVVSSTRLTVHHAHGSKLLTPFSFDADDDGLSRFASYLDQRPRDITYVIADVVEEEFHEETIPHVPAWDRRALLRARAARAFRNTQYVHSMMLAREPHGRRDDRVLFSAITRSGVLSPWLAPMADRAVPLAGICSPAILGQGLLRASGADGAYVLLVSLQSSGELRQTCFREGRVRLSRLASMPDPGSERLGSEILVEIERMRRYLGGLTAQTPQSRLDVRVMAHGSMLDDVRHALQSDAAGDLRDVCAPVDLADVARGLGLRRWRGETTSDRLLVHLLLERPPPNHYATPEETRAYSTLRARTHLKAAAVALLAGACLMGGVDVLEGIVANGYARSLALQGTLYASRYRAARATLPAAPAEAAELERVVSAANVLRRRRADPVDLLALISEGLAAFPRVRIESVSWVVSEDAEAPIHGVDPEDGAGADSHPDGGEQRRDSGHLYQLARLRARIDSFDGDYREAIDTVHRLADALATYSGVEHVRILSLPLDLSSEQTLIGDARETGSNADFEIRMALRVMGTGDAEV